MPFDIVPIAGATGTHVRILLPVSVLHPIMPVSCIVPVLLAATHRRYRDTTICNVMYAILRRMGTAEALLLRNVLRTQGLEFEQDFIRCYVVFAVEAEALVLRNVFEDTRVGV